MGLSFSLEVPVSSLPAVFGDIKDNPVWIFEFSLEVSLAFVAKVKEKFPSMGFDAFLSLDKVVDLEAEVMGAHEFRRVP